MSNYGIANALSLFRLAAAILIATTPWFQSQEDWGWTILLFLFAALSEPIDGRIARRKDGAGSPKGKLLNEIATGALCVLPQASLLGWLWANSPNLWLNSWAWWCVIFVVGTLAFIGIRAYLSGIFAEASEVVQAWFTALIVGVTTFYYFRISDQGPWTQNKTELLVLAICIVTMVVALLSGKRLYSRPQERAAGVYNKK